MKHAMAALAVASIITGCGSAGTPPAPADRDSQFIDRLKSHGVHAPPGMSEAHWESMAIHQAQLTCDMIRQGVISRDVLTSESVGDAKAINEATIATYCPR